MAVYLIEAGLLLVFAPWMGLWQRNYFAAELPWLGLLMENAFVRGAVTGVGLITAFAGIRDVTNVLLARHESPVSRGEHA